MDPLKVFVTVIEQKNFSRAGYPEPVAARSQSSHKESGK